MVARTNHGGYCCGAFHLYGFGDDDGDIDLRDIDTELARLPNGRHVNVMLNGRQMDDLPGVLARLSEFGFVMDGHFINDNHNSDVYSFSRCGQRRTLYHPNWAAVNGQVISAGLCGNLPIVHWTVPRGNQRHEGGDAPAVPAAEPAGAEPTVVASFYSNVYRTSGRADFLYRTYGEARDRALTAVRTDRLDVYSDGISTWVEDVNR